MLHMVHIHYSWTFHISLTASRSEYPIRWEFNNKVSGAAKLADDIHWVAVVCVDLSLYEINRFVANSLALTLVFIRTFVFIFIFIIFSYLYLYFVFIRIFRGIVSSISILVMYSIHRVSIPGSID